MSGNRLVKDNSFEVSLALTHPPAGIDLILTGTFAIDRPGLVSICGCWLLDCGDRCDDDGGFRQTAEPPRHRPLRAFGCLPRVGDHHLACVPSVIGSIELRKRVIQIVIR